MCKKEKTSLFLLSLGWTSRTLAQDASGKTGRSRWPRAARSVSSNPSSNLVRLAALVALVN